MKSLLPAVENVVMDSVDWEDRRFAIERYLPCPELEESLARFGLLTSPRVFRTAEAKLIIVDGFKRLRVLRDRGIVSVPCVVIPVGTDLGSLWAMRLEARLFEPPMNVAEKAQVVSRLASSSMGHDLARRFLDAWGLPQRTEILQKWERLAEAGRHLLAAAACGDIHERAALELASWPEDVEARSRLIDILRSLRCSASIQFEIIERFRDIAMMRSQPVRDLLRSDELQHILDHPDWNCREKTQALRDWLATLCFPRLKARERRLVEQLGQAPPPAGVHLIPPPSFEGNRWKLEVTFSDAHDLERRLDQVRSWSCASGFREVLASGLEPPTVGSHPNR